MPRTLADLVAGLDRAADGPKLFIGPAPSVGRRRGFGGLTVAQALEFYQASIEA